MENLEQMTGKLILVDDCEDYEGWNGKVLLLLYSDSEIPKNVSYCYLGKDFCYICGDEEIELEYGEIKIWRLPLGTLELIDFIETMKRVGPETEKEKELQNFLILSRIRDLEGEISRLEHEIKKLESLFSS